MRSDKKPLMRELKWTTFFLGTAMLALWLLFYAYMHHVFSNYVVENMKQASSSIILELNQSFLKLDEVIYALSDNEEVADFLNIDNGADFYTKASSVGRILNQYSPDAVFMDNVVIYNPNRRFYRFSGDISNTGMRRIMAVAEGSKDIKYIQIMLDEKNYIGYVGTINYKNSIIGKVVMLTDEDDVYRLFGEITENDNIHIALAAEGKIIVASEKTMVEEKVDEIVSNNAYNMRKQVGFTPFELLVTYEDSDNRLDYLFLIAMFIMAVILAFLMKFFLDLWKKKFFVPIQDVISEVETFQGDKEKILLLTGMEHFDGLIRGINDMVERIERQEKEVYEAAYQLQEAEIEKQKALIVSLKKQISAHFTVNVLNSISALSSTGENEKAGMLCDGLSYLLRYANAGDSFIGGMDELFVLQKYADIMEIRYPERFTVVIDMEDYLEDIRLPRMLLQPVVENSIVHGFPETESKEKGIIHIYSELKEDSVIFIIEDNGQGMNAEELDALTERLNDTDTETDISEGLSHVALKNIQRRIHSYFGKEYGIQIQSKPGYGTRVSVELPAGIQNAGISRSGATRNVH